MHILVFGGTFNPPHLGHQLMVEQVLSRQLSQPGDGVQDEVEFDQVWLLPVGQHSFAKTFVSNKHRLAMLELMMEAIIEKLPQLAGKMRIETYELERAEESQTFATLEALSAQYPEHRFSFLIGSDNLAKFHLWHDYELMLSKYRFYVYPREAFAFTPLRQGMVALTGFPLMRVSSTQVRQILESVSANEQNHSSLNAWLDAKVIAYINEQQLFSKESHGQN